MLDFLFILGQAASAMLLIYGGFLALMPAKKAFGETQRRRDERDALGHPRLTTRFTIPPPGPLSGPLF